jgi:putative oxidoreductase
MQALKGLVSLLGRVLLSAIFLMSAAANHIPRFNEDAGMLAGKIQGLIKDAPPWLPQVAMGGAIAFMILGGVSVLVGFKARIGALLLFLFLAAATYFFHDFWNAGGEAYANQMIHFMKNAAIAGGMLFVVANGGGAWSLDACFKGAPAGATV